MKTTTIVLAVLAALMICICILISMIFGIGLFAFRASGSERPAITQPADTASPAPTLPTNTPLNELETAFATMETLLQADLPEKDTLDLMTRIGGVFVPIPETVPAPAVPLSVGEQQTFWGSNTDTNKTFEIDATLQHITEHSYFWIENGVRYDPEDLVLLAEDFEYHIYPTVRAFFGSEWSPGVDNDPRIYILFARNLGVNLAGYFSSADELHPLAHEYSNAHEMFFISADNAGLDEAYTYGVLAHEFQHMIHWNTDRNEEAWVNEGFAELATLLTNYYDGGFDTDYANDPDIPLMVWPDNGRTIPHYGGSFLFMAYFLDRFGEDVTRALVAHPANGLNGIDRLMQELNIFDPIRGASTNADGLFQDFAAALFLHDPLAGDGRYAFSAYPETPKTVHTETFSRCPSRPANRVVNQFGIDYIRITCTGQHTLNFQGRTAIELTPAENAPENHFFWSNRADEADMTLTRLFDFTDHTGALTLEYRTWFDIESDFDYAYVLASTNGKYWDILTTPHSTIENPVGNSFGWAYNGQSPGWLSESVDLSEYAGQQVWIRFEYVTDGAVSGEGLLLDDIAIPEAGYFTDFEQGQDGWEAAGFVRVANLVPQPYLLTLVRFIDGRAEVTYLEADPRNALSIPLDIGGEVDEVVLIISGANRFSRQPAAYSVEIQQ